jgi:hypothetical protein
MTVKRADFEAAVRTALAHPPMIEQERVAFDLYGASFWMPREDARLVMLTIAAEVLSEDVPRSEAAQHHVRRLMEITDDAPDLTQEEKNSLRGSLERFMNESIGHAVRRLAARLGSRRYMDTDAGQFFGKCAYLRNRPVHRSVPSFVGDLLAGRLLNADIDAKG